MKKISMFVLSWMVFVSSVFAVDFTPTLLKLTAQPWVQYEFDGSNLIIPFTVSGKPSSTLFSVFTKEKGETISNVRNGFLGWHYVNKIDTSIYVSPAENYPIGNNTIVWDGKDENGNLVSVGDYTYYLWGYDNSSPKVKVTATVTPSWNIHIQEKGTDGKPLANPMLVTGLKRWTIGNNPFEDGLLETSSITLPEGYAMNAAWQPIHKVALEQNNFNNFFVQLGTTTSLGIAKYEWVPNGQSTLVTSFGDNGISFVNGKKTWDTGVVTDGTYLYSADEENADMSEAIAKLFVMDLDGNLINTIDMTNWWSNTNDLSGGGQLNGGPNCISYRNGYVSLNSHASCLKQMVNPLVEDTADFVVWSNGNGDHIMDHNDSTTDPNPWVCFDWNPAPYAYSVAEDSNMFVAHPSYGIGASSFSLMAPDGTGIGYLSFSGETVNGKAGLLICDSGSAYDGFYASNNQNELGSVQDANSYGTWFVGQDSFKGTISKQVGVADVAPAAFTVAQNIPNPFNPTTTISFTLAKAGKTTVEVFNVAGQKIDTIVNASLSAGTHSTIWNATKFSAGVYFYTVKSGSFSKTMKMTLLK
jgi:flagellar hook assembly protein FlgD